MIIINTKQNITQIIIQNSFLLLVDLTNKELLHNQVNRLLCNDNNICSIITDTLFRTYINNPKLFSNLMPNNTFMISY